VKISIIAGTHRREAESQRVAQYLHGVLEKMGVSSYKNTRICYIPDHVIVRNVGQVLRGDQAADEYASSLRARIEYSLRVLLEYAAALRQVRESGVIDLNRFPCGM